MMLFKTAVFVGQTLLLSGCIMATCNQSASDSQSTCLSFINSPPTATTTTTTSIPVSPTSGIPGASLLAVPSAPSIEINRR